VPNAIIDSVVRQIADRFDPERIILVGSYAQGTAGPDSDVDMLVIMNTSLRESEQAVRICQAIDYHFGLDLLVRTPETLDRRIHLRDAFLRDVVATGRTLYACSHG
jgi:uncharacterized protein